MAEFSVVGFLNRPKGALRELLSSFKGATITKESSSDGSQIVSIPSGYGEKFICQAYAANLFAKRL